MAATPITSTVQSRNAPNNVAAGGSAADATNGNSFANDGDTLLVVRTTGTAVTPSVAYAVTLDGTAPAARSLGALGATATTILGPFPPETYGSTVTVTWSVATGVSFYVLQPTK